MPFDTIGVNLDAMTMFRHGDHFRLYTGDSWSVHYIRDRLPFALALVGEMMGDRLASLRVGSSLAAPANSPMIDHTVHATGLAGAESSNNYLVGKTGGVATDWDATPISQIYGGYSRDTTLGGSLKAPFNKYIDWFLDNASLGSGNNLPMLAAGESMTARVFYWCPTNRTARQYALPRVYPGTSTATYWSINHRSQAGGMHSDGDAVPGTGINSKEGFINYLYESFPLPADELGIRIGVHGEFDKSSTGGSKDWHLKYAGVQFTRQVTEKEGGQDAQGAHVMVLAESGWTLAQMGTNTATTGAGEKQASDDQLRYTLDSSITDLTRPVYVVLYVDTERLPQATLEAQVAAYWSRMRSILTAIGVTDQRLLLVGPPMHIVGGATSWQACIDAVETHNAAYEAVANADPTVSFASFYAATEGVFFGHDGAYGLVMVPAGENAKGMAWLDSHGFDEFALGGTTYDVTAAPYGDLWDSIGLHWSSQTGTSGVAGAVFGTILTWILNGTLGATRLKTIRGRDVDRLRL